MKLISREYLEEQKKLHASPRGYGGKGNKWAEVVVGLAAHYKCASILDYGCGQGTLAIALKQLGRDCRQYDPAIPKHAAMPEPSDLVVCTDVIEHIEPDCLDSVLKHLRMLTKKALFFVAATRPASKTLSDGRNAHLIIESAEWWAAKVSAAGFTIRPEVPVSPSTKPSREWVAVLT